MSDPDRIDNVLDDTELGQGDLADFVAMTVNGQLFGVSVMSVRDVLGPQRITRIPLAPAEVMGVLNLRGRIVTAIDVRRRLGIPDREEGASYMSVVIDHGGELYSLIVDAVGEVLSLAAETYENNPATLDPPLKTLSKGIYRLDVTLLVVLDVAQLLNFPSREAA